MGNKLGRLFQQVLDVWVSDSGSRHGRQLRILVEVDLEQMATAAFKSTSKRGTQNSTATSKSHNSNANPAARKRSQSVSAISRAKHIVDITSEFYNKRENPLFLNSNSSSSPPAGDQESNEISKRTEKEKRTVESTTKTASGTVAAERGRSFTRNSGAKNGIGRSLSRVRRRSVSRGPHGAYESDKEQEMTMLTNAQVNGDIKSVANNLKLVNGEKNGGDLQRWRSPQITGSQCQAAECSEDDSVCSFQFSNWVDGASTCSLTEAEDRTIKAVFEQMKANKFGGNATASGIYETVRSEVRRALSDIQNDIESAMRWSNVNSVPVTDITDIPPDLVNSRPVELVSDIRREYTRKLEESEEQARKLRADLAVEEQRGQEFSRMLKGTLPDPQATNPQKSHMGRKRSTERKKISKRLTEEAMAYFDECVSISTFDGSDFSASEEPPPTSAGISNPICDPVSTPQGSSNINLQLYVPDCSSYNKKTLNGHDQLMQCCEDSDLTADSSCNTFSVEQDGTKSGKSNQQYQFSFAQKQRENMRFKNSIKSYVEHFQRGISVNTRSDYDAGECKLRGCVESLLFDRVFFSNRLESGSLHLCGGSVAVSFSPFGSIL